MHNCVDRRQGAPLVPVAEELQGLCTWLCALLPQTAALWPASKP